MKIELYIYKVKVLNSQVSSDNLMVCRHESHGGISQPGEEEAFIGTTAPPSGKVSTVSLQTVPPR